MHKRRQPVIFAIWRDNTDKLIDFTRTIKEDDYRQPLPDAREFIEASRGCATPIPVSLKLMTKEVAARRGSRPPPLSDRGHNADAAATRSAAMLA